MDFIIYILYIYFYLHLIEYLLLDNNKKSINIIQSLCKFDLLKQKPKVCKIPCNLKTNYSFPKNRKWLCKRDELYTLNDTIVYFNEKVTFIEYWIHNNKLNSNIKYFKVYNLI